MTEAPSTGRVATWRVPALMVLCLIIGIVIGSVGPYILMARSGADLEPWHRLQPELEFTADQGDDIKDLEDYRALESRLFEDIAKKLDRDAEAWPMLSRLDPASPTNPNTFPFNWNHTYRLEPDTVVAGALLLHGLSDSPYSLHAVAEHLQSRGVLCVGLRLPGHGGVPGGLTASRYEDWQAAVRIGIRAVREKLGAVPASDPGRLFQRRSPGPGLLPRCHR